MKARPKLRLFLLAVIAVLAGLAALGWALKPMPRGSAEAAAFKAELVQAISDADRIDVVEHSWGSDFEDANGRQLENPPDIEYKRASLEADQRRQLGEAFKTMSAAPKTGFSPCTFDPHHRIEIFAKNGEKRVIFVCFKCRDTEWYKSDGTDPSGFRQVHAYRYTTESFQDVFREFIEPLGFQASREWEQLAAARSGKIVEPDPFACPQFGFLSGPPKS